jgi:alkylated DNA repair dioxygenase AlkB
VSAASAVDAGPFTDPGQGELFPRRTAAALPADFVYLPDWLDRPEAERRFAELAADTPWEEHSLTIAGRTMRMPRCVAFYGPFDYAYSGIQHAARPMPPLVADLAGGAAAAAAQPMNTVLMNLYSSGGDSVSWHSDNDYDHGGHPAVASLSLGAIRRFHIAHKRQAAERYAIDLLPGSLLVMKGRSQLDYRHALPKTARPVGRRVNLTFRYMARPNI